MESIILRGSDRNSRRERAGLGYLLTTACPAPGVRQADRRVHEKRRLTALGALALLGGLHIDGSEKVLRRA